MQKTIKVTLFFSLWSSILLTDPFAPTIRSSRKLHCLRNLHRNKLIIKRMWGNRMKKWCGVRGTRYGENHEWENGVRYAACGMRSCRLRIACWRRRSPALRDRAVKTCRTAKPNNNLHAVKPSCRNVFLHCCPG